MIPLIYLIVGVIMTPIMIWITYKVGMKREYTLADLLKLPIFVLIYPIGIVAIYATIIEKYDNEVIWDAREWFDRKEIEMEEQDNFNERIGS
jgi:hypothetical protein